MKLNPKKMEKMAKRMGLKADSIEAEEVIIKTRDKDIVVSQPRVTKIDMMGQETFQVSGEIAEEEKEKFTEEDIKTVAEKSGASEEEAKKALEETEDMAQAIMKLKK